MQNCNGIPAVLSLYIPTSPNKEHVESDMCIILMWLDTSSFPDYSKTVSNLPQLKLQYVTFDWHCPHFVLNSLTFLCINWTSLVWLRCLTGSSGCPRKVLNEVWWTTSWKMTTSVVYHINLEIYYMWCDQAKWVGTRLYWFLDHHNSVQFPLYFIVLSITKKAISLEPLVQFWYGFSNIIKREKWGLQRNRNMCFNFVGVQTHFAWSHHIFLSYNSAKYGFVGLPIANVLR